VKILVTAKRVVDPETKVRLRPDRKGLSTDGVTWVVNYFDLIAVEEALKIRDAAGGGEVVVLGIGPADIAQEIRKCLAMGADRGILINEAGEVDSDLVARTVAKVYEQEKPDLVLMGKLATDDENNQAGQMFAEYAGLPQACFAYKIAVAGGKATVVREIDGGLETVELTLPAVITTDLRLNEPRYASLPGIMKARAKPLKTLTFKELGVDAACTVTVEAVGEPPPRPAGVKVPDVASLLNKLQNEAKVL
jgi:electron transfer flavoprotein beta subunit